MRLAALGFLIGIVLLQQLASLPPLLSSLSLFILIPLACYFTKWCLLLCVGLGFFWASATGHFFLANSQDASLEGKDLVVEGYVSSLPEKRDHRVQFQFEPVSLTQAGMPQPLPGRILLSWHGTQTLKYRLENYGVYRCA